MADSRLSFCLLYLTASALAQVRGLVTTDDGSIVYFSSELRARGTDQFLHSKIFRLDGEGLKLFAQREQSWGPYFGNYSTSNYYNLHSPDISGDGSVVTYVATSSCRGTTSACIGRFGLSSSTVLGVPGQPELQFSGRVRLSANGRFALIGSAVRYPSLLSSFGVVDLHTGGALAGPADSCSVPASGGRAVSSNGVGIARCSQTLTQTLVKLTYPAGRETLVTTQDPIGSAVIDDNATRVVYQTGFGTSGSPRTLHALDLSTGTGKPLVRSDGDMFGPSLSGNGRRVLFLSGENLTGDNPARLTQAHVINSDGTDLRQLTNKEAIVEATLSGNGRVAYAVTELGRLLRIDVDSREAREWISRTPQVIYDSTLQPRPPVAGSMYRVRGKGLADQTAVTQSPLPSVLGGVSLELDGMRLPLSMVSPGELYFQIPWAVSSLPGPPPFRVTIGSNSVFESAFDLWPVPQCGQFEWREDPTTGQSMVLGAHDQPARLLTQLDPARPGEIIHLYLTGLGPVSPLVEDGASSPSNPPARSLASLECAVVSGRQRLPAEVLFAGLAPGLVGIYQASIRVPPLLLGEGRCPRTILGLPVVCAPPPPPGPRPTRLSEIYCGVVSPPSTNYGCRETGTWIPIAGLRPPRRR